MLFWLFLGILSLNDPTNGINEPEENDDLCSTNLHDVSLNRNYVLPTKRWPNATVIYKFDNSVNETEKEIFKKDLSEIENASCVIWKELPEIDKGPYTLITTKDSGCFAQLGIPDEGKKYGTLNLYRGGKGGLSCWEPRTIKHESLHILGASHEHNRADRDDYVIINWENIKDSMKEEFFKDAGNSYPKCKVTRDRKNYDNCSSRKERETFGLPYDYDSIMHYQSNAHSIAHGKYTVTKKNGDLIYYSDKLSNGDIKKLNRAYCSSDVESKLKFCQQIKKNNLETCTLPEAILSCPYTCGVLNAKCRDQSRECRKGVDCSSPKWKYMCKKTCGQCQDCEDLIHSYVCQRYAGTSCFLDDNMRYACNKTCELCNKPQCQDRNEEFCQKINETECVNPRTAHICSKTCGACNAKCKNFHPKCFEYSHGNECENEKYKSMCPLSCGTCDVCENLIEDGICKNIVASNNTLCNTDMNVRYSCRKACGRCGLNIDVTKLLKKISATSMVPWSWFL